MRLWRRREGKFDELAEYCAQDVIIMVFVVQLNNVVFCQKRRHLETRLQTHLGLGSIDTKTLQITTKLNCRPLGFEKECPCDRPRVPYETTQGATCASTSKMGLTSWQHYRVYWEWFRNDCLIGLMHGSVRNRRIQIVNCIFILSILYFVL